MVAHYTYLLYFKTRIKDHFFALNEKSISPICIIIQMFISYMILVDRIKKSLRLGFFYKKKQDQLKKGNHYENKLNTLKLYNKHFYFFQIKTCLHT